MGEVVRQLVHGMSSEAKDLKEQARHALEQEGREPDDDLKARLAALPEEDRERIMSYFRERSRQVIQWSNALDLCRNRPVTPVNYGEAAARLREQGSL